DLPRGRGDLLPPRAAGRGGRADPPAPPRADRLPARARRARRGRRAARVRHAALPRTGGDPDRGAGRGGGRRRAARTEPGGRMTLTAQRATVAVVAVLAAAWLLVSYVNAHRVNDVMLTAGSQSASAEELEAALRDARRGQPLDPSRG